MRRALHYVMIILLIFLCGSGLSFSRTESLLHEWCGILLFALVIVHLVWNRKWFIGVFRGKYNTNRILITVTDIMLIVLILMIAVSAMVISGYVFSFLELQGATWGRRIHFAGTAWLFLLSGIHFGMHIKMEKRNIVLYIAAAGGIAAFVVCRFYERLFLLNEFAFIPSVSSWVVYLLNALMFCTFMCIGSEIKRLTAKKRKKHG
ncbi:protein of unknown function [Pseudobutyrivibrio sp. YE44]|uniref:cytochrome b/b6 domain-containing protein n=1 Tax=Pseudobutyrivibrio sp. YE44 TaxID=1520802 RepID=UPI00087FD193|nr:cytochrome b/b6 domain-containing protein [Pseudobutyrivibrio sp. YE44]SDB34209.1 protein of unknown function [Pseudobutyrivibrio sp. YE44]